MTLIAHAYKNQYNLIEVIPLGMTYSSKSHRLSN